MSTNSTVRKTKKCKNGLTFIMYGEYGKPYRIEQKQIDSQGVIITTWRFNNGEEARKKWNALTTLP